MPSNIHPSLTKPVYVNLAPWAKEHAKQHWSTCKRERCYWHHQGDMFSEKEYLEKDQKEKLWVIKNNKHSPSPKLLNAGEEKRSRALIPERKGNRSLSCETTQGLGQGDQSPSKQKNHIEQNTGKTDPQVRKL
jgi:hypothetical protein